TGLAHRIPLPGQPHPPEAAAPRELGFRCHAVVGERHPRVRARPDQPPGPQPAELTGIAQQVEKRHVISRRPLRRRRPGPPPPPGAPGLAPGPPAHSSRPPSGAVRSPPPLPPASRSATRTTRYPAASHARFPALLPSSASHVRFPALLPSSASSFPASASPSS